MNRPISEKGINKTKKICEFLKKKKCHLMKYSVHHQKEPKKHLDIIIKYLPNKPLVNYLENLYHTSTVDIFDTVMLEAKKKKSFNSFSSTIII